MGTGQKAIADKYGLGTHPLSMPYGTAGDLLLRLSAQVVSPQPSCSLNKIEFRDSALSVFGR